MVTVGVLQGLAKTHPDVGSQFGPALTFSRRDPALVKQFLDGLDAGFLFQEQVPILLGDQTEVVALFGEPAVAAVVPQAEPVFGAAGEHAVGFLGSQGHQVVDEHPGVRLGPGENQRLLSPQFFARR